MFIRNPFRLPFLRFMSAEEGAPTDGVVEDSAPVDEPLGESGLKALQQEREARKQYEKDLSDAHARLKEFEDAQKSDEEKKAEAEAARVKELEETSAAKAHAEAKALRYEIAAEKGIDLKLAGRLTGATREELEADADSFLELLGAVEPKQPKPDPSAGKGAEPVKPRTLNDAISQHYS